MIHQLEKQNQSQITVDVVPEHWKETIAPPDVEQLSQDEFTSLMEKSMTQHMSKINPILEKQEQAEQYVVDNAQRLGWQIANSTYCLDGGSHGKYYIKIINNKLIKVYYYVKASTTGVYPTSYLSKEFGTMFYEFSEHPQPVIYQGFPLPLVDEPTNHQRTNHSSFITISKDQIIYDKLTLLQLPELFGWQPNKSPLLTDQLYLFEKSSSVVGIRFHTPDKNLQDWDRCDFIFYDSADAMHANYAKEIAPKATFTTGGIIKDGKYLRRPYSIELQEDKIILNGSIYRDLDLDKIYLDKKKSLRKSGSSNEFICLIDSLSKNKHFLRLESQGNSSTTLSFKKDQELQNFIRSIDHIIDTSPDKDKELQSLGINVDRIRKEIIDNWEGHD